MEYPEAHIILVRHSDGVVPINIMKYIGLKGLNIKGNYDEESFISYCSRLVRVRYDTIHNESLNAKSILWLGVFYMINSRNKRFGKYLSN
jgi:hypothetical protein